MDITSLTQPKDLPQQLESERHKYKEAFEQDKPFAFIKRIQLRIRELEEKIISLLKRK